MHRRTLQAGVARAVITPPVGFAICSPEFENRMSTGVNDDLFARCLVLDDGAERCSLVSLDVFALNPQLERAIKDAIFQSNSINSTNILIACTGNTTSPATWQDPKFDAVGYENYLRYLPEVVAGVVSEAINSMQAAAIGTTSVAVPNLSCFNEETEDPSLHSAREQLTMVSIQSADGNTICLVLNYACPASILGISDQWSADFPGETTAALENYGVECAIFLPAPNSDVRPFDWSDDNPTPSHSNRTQTDAGAFAILLATQAMRGLPRVVARRNAPITSRKFACGSGRVFTVGEARFVGIQQTQPVEFSATVRLGSGAAQAIVTSPSWPYGRVPVFDAALASSTVQALERISGRPPS